MELALAVGILLALTLVFFAPLWQEKTFSVVPNRQVGVFPWAALPDATRAAHTYPQTDQADVFQPWTAFISTTLRSGAFPYWEPHSFGGGYPFFANGHSSVLYPPRLVAALTLDPARSHDLISAMHVFLAGLFMYVMMKEFRVGLAGSLLAAIAWMFSGFNMAWLHLESVASVSVFLPLTILCVHWAFRARSFLATTVAASALALALYSGTVLFLGLVYLVAIGYAASLAAGRMISAVRQGDFRPGARALQQFGLLVVVSLGLAAVVLVPTAFALADSQRDSFSYRELGTTWLAPARTLLYTLFPPPLPITSPRMHEMAFAGTVPGFLAMIALLGRRPGAWLGRVLLVTTFAIVLGTPLTWLAYHAIPGFQVFRPYSRLLFLVGFAVALLAGLGLDRLCRWSRRLPGSPRSDRPRMLATQRARRITVAVATAAVVLTAVQVVPYGRDVNPPFEPRREELLFPATSLIEAVRNDVSNPGAWPGRIIPVLPVDERGGAGQPILFTAEALLFGIDTAGGYDSSVPRRQAALLRVLQGGEVDAVLSSGLGGAYAPFYPSSITRFELLGRLGITTIVASPRQASLENWRSGGLPPLTTVYESPQGRVLHVEGSQPGPYLVEGEEWVPSADEALRRFVRPDFDFRRSVVLEEGDGAQRNRTTSGIPGDAGRIVSATKGVNTARVELATRGPAWLVFPETWSKGWSATIDGKRTSVRRANYSQRAIRVPGGESTVKLRYRPAGLDVGLTLTLMTMLCLAFALFETRSANSRGKKPGKWPPSRSRGLESAMPGSSTAIHGDGNPRARLPPRLRPLSFTAGRTPPKSPATLFTAVGPASASPA
ncbi:MAG: YfhO family protein [Actinomycetota bacterium]|nr:YfhO family protein [Actinomycetota bacterium]